MATGAFWALMLIIGALGLVCATGLVMIYILGL